MNTTASHVPPGGRGESRPSQGESRPIARSTTRSRGVGTPSCAERPAPTMTRTQVEGGERQAADTAVGHRALLHVLQLARVVHETARAALPTAPRLADCAEVDRGDGCAAGGTRAAHTHGRVRPSNDAAPPFPPPLPLTAAKKIRRDDGFATRVVAPLFFISRV